MSIPSGAQGVRIMESMGGGEREGRVSGSEGWGQEI